MLQLPIQLAMLAADKPGWTDLIWIVIVVGFAALGQLAEWLRRRSDAAKKEQRQKSVEAQPTPERRDTRPVARPRAAPAPSPQRRPDVAPRPIKAPQRQAGPATTVRHVPPPPQRAVQKSETLAKPGPKAVAAAVKSRTEPQRKPAKPSKAPPVVDEPSAYDISVGRSKSARSAGGEVRSGYNLADMPKYELRRAFVMREIFNLPVALRDDDALSGP